MSRVWYLSDVEPRFGIRMFNLWRIIRWRSRGERVIGQIPHGNVRCGWDDAEFSYIPVLNFNVLAVLPSWSANCLLKLRRIPDMRRLFQFAVPGMLVGLGLFINTTVSFGKPEYAKATKKGC